MIVHATATKGTTSVFEMTSETKLSTPSGSQNVEAVTMSDATITAPMVMMITPKTFQPYPRRARGSGRTTRRRTSPRPRSTGRSRTRS